MRRVLLLAHLVTVLPGIGCGGAPLATPPAAAAESDPVWEAYRKAAGGDALSGVHSVRATGITVDAADGVNRRLTIEAAPPARYRLRETPARQEDRRFRRLIGYNGTVGWMAGTTRLGGDGLSPDAAVRDRAVTAAGRQNYINMVAGMFPLWLRGAGLTMETLGPMTDGPDRGSIAIRLSADGALVGRLTLDAGTHLPRSLVVPYLRSVRPEGGDYRITFHDYKDVGQGVRLPHRIAREQGAGDGPKTTVQWIIRSYQLNPPLDPSTFEPPPQR